MQDRASEGDVGGRKAIMQHNTGDGSIQVRGREAEEQSGNPGNVEDWARWTEERRGG